MDKRDVEELQNDWEDENLAKINDYPRSSYTRGGRITGPPRL